VEIKEIIDNPELDIVEKIWKIHKLEPKRTPYNIALNLRVFKITKTGKRYYDEGSVRKILRYMKKYNYILENGVEKV